jgi:hypothetical protein
MQIYVVHIISRVFIKNIPYLLFILIVGYLNARLLPYLHLTHNVGYLQFNTQYLKFHTGGDDPREYIDQA